MYFPPITAKWLYLHYGVQCDAYGIVCNLPTSGKEIKQILQDTLQYLKHAKKDGINQSKYQEIEDGIRAAL